MKEVQGTSLIDNSKRICKTPIRFKRDRVQLKWLYKKLSPGTHLDCVKRDWEANISNPELESPGSHCTSGTFDCFEELVVNFMNKKPENMDRVLKKCIIKPSLRKTIGDKLKQWADEHG